MATAPCPFGRPEGMELVRSVRVTSGPDLKLILASHATSFDTNDRNYYYVPFESVSQEMNIRGDKHQKLIILDAHPAGPDRVHILGSTPHGSRVIVENFNYRTGKGSYYEFSSINGHRVGSIYLFDTRKIFPPDSSYEGLVVKASFNDDIQASQLSALLKERGYKIHVFNEKIPLLNNDHGGCMTHLPIMGIPCGGIQLVHIADFHDKAMYEPVADVITAGSYILAEKLGETAICCRTRELKNACTRGYDCLLLNTCDAAKNL